MTIASLPLRAAIAATLLLAATGAARAQDAPARSGGWELRVATGGLIATGALRSNLKDAPVTAVQLSWLAAPRVAITGTFGWARSRDLATTGTPKLDVFTSDLGAEVRSGAPVRLRRLSLSGFVGAGAGARSYNHRKLERDATHHLAAYASVGGEIGMGRVALRLEARDYLTGFGAAAAAGTSPVRNDVVLMAALRFARRQQAEAR